MQSPDLGVGGSKHSDSIGLLSVTRGFYFSNPLLAGERIGALVGSFESGCMS